jgi:hypothetical protein
MSESLITQPPGTFAPAQLRRSLGDALEMMHGVDAVALEERAASLAVMPDSSRVLAAPGSPGARNS